MNKYSACLKLARAIASQAYCRKAQVGAIIFDKNGSIIGTGYNTGKCAEGCPALMDPTNSTSCNTVHAEINAINYCVDISRAVTIVVTKKPCDKCLQALNSTPIQKVIYNEDTI